MNTKQFLAAALLLVMAAAGGCRDWYPPNDPKDPKDSVITTPPGTALVDTRWCLQSIQTVNSGPDTVDPAVGIYITFTAAGRFKGFGGCNDFSGSYKTNAKVMTISDLVSTSKPCAQPLLQYEPTLLPALAAAMSYEINGDHLSIQYASSNSFGAVHQGGTLVFVACRAVDPPPPPPSDLVGQRWCFDGFSIAGTNTYDRVDPSWDINIVFDKDGHVSGNGGCNGFGGDYLAQGDQLKIFNLISTKIYCADRSQTEQRFMSALEGVASYRVTGDRLYLNYSGPNANPTGTTLQFHSCSTPGDPSDPGDVIRAVIGQQFDLPYGRQAQVDLGTNSFGMTIRLLSVRDSRCPKGVTCIWAGSAWATLDVALSGVSTQLTLETPGNAANATNVGYLNGYKIELIAVSPYPVANQTIDQKDYIATLVVTKK